MKDCGDETNDAHPSAPRRIELEFPERFLHEISFAKANIGKAPHLTGILREFQKTRRPFDGEDLAGETD